MSPCFHWFGFLNHWGYNSQINGSLFLQCGKRPVADSTICIHSNDFCLLQPKISSNTSAVVPAAEGSVKIKKDKNDNHAIDVEKRNLAEPKRLPVPQSVYSVNRKQGWN